MKRVIILNLLVIMTFFTGCFGNKDNNTDTINTGGGSASVVTVSGNLSTISSATTNGSIAFNTTGTSVTGKYKYILA
ncbi:hypothetical protein EV215_0258 [Hypnocyclicus thermotrophus]|uniref:Uncharacterized protein n=1 Tax=Hypnocyclicus thermotrophus TaxID=1627895 RepID=A0AA46E0M7_9FUSO|nr:hypothetical protein [Hypnocyclicus thermotrophus]TDT72452.1 hypothetical protein EV215_0258 [Hypnocyclicus thermotrophus]